MTNLISRQAAIDLAMQYCPDDDGTYSKADEDIRNLLDELEDLPSAQRWIPVSERLPEKNSDPEKYIDQWLCCTSDGDVMILLYGTPGNGIEECVFYKWDDDGYFHQVFDVIAWMPIPKPYNEDEDNGDIH